MSIGMIILVLILTAYTVVLGVLGYKLVQEQSDKLLYKALYDLQAKKIQNIENMFNAGGTH